MSPFKKELLNEVERVLGKLFMETGPKENTSVISVKGLYDEHTHEKLMPLGFTFDELIAVHSIRQIYARHGEELREWARTGIDFFFLKRNERIGDPNYRIVDFEMSHDGWAELDIFLADWAEREDELSEVRALRKKIILSTHEAEAEK